MAEPPSRSSKPRVLVVDDSRPMRMVLVDILLRKGYQIVGEAADGEEAVATYQDLVRQNAEPDIVTMDIDMPKMDGMTASRNILAQYPGASIIMFTSHREDKIMKEAQGFGVKDFIVKPADEALILATFKKVSEAAAAPAGRPPGLGGGKPGVLIVDDSSIVRSMLREMLTKAGFEVIGQAANGDDALVLYETLVRERRQPDVVTMDVEMPKVDGMTASRNILAKYPDAQIVMFTSKQDERFFTESFKLGVKDFVVKSQIGTADTAIIATLQRLVGSGRRPIALAPGSDSLEVVREVDYATQKEEAPEDTLVRSALSRFAQGGSAAAARAPSQPYIPSAVYSQGTGDRGPGAGTAPVPAANNRYRVVCHGISPGLPVEPTVLRVAEHFKFPVERARELLNQTSTVKRNLDGDTAQALRRKLAAIGLKVEVLAME